MTAIELWTPTALILAGATLLLLGTVTLALLQLRPNMRGAIKTVWPDFRALVLTFTLIAVTSHWHEFLALPALCAIGARIGWELARTVTPGQLPLALVAVAFGACIPLIPAPIFAFLYLWIGLFALRVVVSDPRAPLILDPLLFPVLPFAIFAAGFADPTLTVVFLAAFLLGETFDSYSLLAGRLFGRRPLAPRLSPGKTIEGALGGGIMVICTAAIAAVIAADIAFWPALICAALVGSASLAGDLSASHLKRRAGVKDFPKLLPPQGGLLDVIDGWIASGAVLALAASPL